MSSFDYQERMTQIEFLSTTCGDQTGFSRSPIRLKKEFIDSNLAPGVRGAVRDFFSRNKIQWHQHANHGLSSQACCVNFFAPLATRPMVLSRLIGAALDIAPPKMIPVAESPSGCDWFVDFEYIGRANYLNEWPKDGTPTRGANATAADAVVRFESAAGEEALLIEWKYTEHYGQPLGAKGNAKRLGRYQQIVFAPDGPIRADLGLQVEDFFWEPFYQLLRQQMLAYRMEADPNEPAQRVRVLHISPNGNTALKKVTAPALHRFGTDAFDVFRDLLVRPNSFIARSTESLFLAILKDVSPDDRDWADYLLGRYRFLEGKAADLR